ncbi:MAG: bifunctional riboflavin kinase/FAD synthetase [Nostocaceae cyanobacterium]|nr:bifunctional riboflavin kinase/FAD synthetase [Nostocaceae cyanobacterium]
MQNLSQNGCSVWVASSTKSALRPTAVALGKFDGLHLGHQRVIQPVLKSSTTVSQQERSPNLSPVFPESTTEYIYSTVVTFNPHPKEFFSGQPHSLLTPLDEKVQQLLNLGIEQLVLLPFDKELSALTPEEFVEKILVQQLQAVRISVGQDFRFGRKRKGTAEDLQALAAKYGIPVTIVPLEVNLGTSADENGAVNEPISTTLIRETLAQGNIQKANRLLGRPYTLTGIVTKGQHLGRTIGFPTANLELPLDKFLPCQGVYAVRVFTSATTRGTGKDNYLGVMNIGNRPTVNGTEISTEVHLLDWSGDLYDKNLVVQLEKFLRPEQKFSDLEALKQQIQQDCTVARNFFGTEC